MNYCLKQIRHLAFILTLDIQMQILHTFTELKQGTKRQGGRRRASGCVVLLLGSAPCREADIKSCIVLVCVRVRARACVCMLIDWLTQLYSAPL